MDVKECLEKGFLRKIRPDPKLLEKEFREAEFDLRKAKDAFDEKNYKWSIIMAYYSMFHAARSTLFALGLKEKRHFAIGVVLEDLVRQGKLEEIYVNYFNSAMESREGADYRYEYSSEIAKDILEMAEKFIRRMKAFKHP